MAMTDSDILAATETYLDSGVCDAEVQCNGWRVLRNDRLSRGGGVLLAVRVHLEPRRRLDLETGCCEDIWVSLTISKVNVHVCVVYVPPGSPDNVYMKWFTKVESIISALTGITLIVGDLNMNSATLHVKHYYSYFLSVCGLNEMNGVLNAFGSKLDVVLVSDHVTSVAVSKAVGGGLVPRTDAYHPPLDINIELGGEFRQKRISGNGSNGANVKMNWNFSKGNFGMFYDMMSGTAWDRVLSAQDVDEAVAIFYDILYDIFNKCFPKKERTKNNLDCYPVWFTAQLIRDIRLKSVLHRKWKATGDANVYLEFSRLRAKVKLQLRQVYRDYIDRVTVNVKQNPKAFWRHIDDLRGPVGLETRVKVGDEMLEGIDAANAFADYFSSMFLGDIPSLDPRDTMARDTSRSACYVHIDSICEDDVEAGLKKLKPDSSIGPDSLPPYILKACKHYFLSPILHIFNLSIHTGKYPTQWKISRVTPIPKVKNDTSVENYRPIAVLSSVAKLFETVIHRKIVYQITPYLSESQHGFRAGRSVNTNLLTMVDVISASMDRGTQVDVVYFDFRKAFDRVDNDILLAKLCDLGFSPCLLNFFADYLKDRQQFVRHGCHESYSYHTRSGVSQGSILGPLLFLLMINDLERVLKHSKCLLYADDLKLFLGIKEIDDSKLLQEDIEAVYQWSIANRLLFNAEKCCIMSFTRAISPISSQYVLGTVYIPRVECVRDLGVLFNSKLDFRDHIRDLASESYRRLGFVIRNAQDFRDTGVIQLLYTSLVRSKMETASMIWSPYYNCYTLLLEKVQKAFLRFLYRKKYGYYPYMYPTRYLLGMLGFNSLETRRNFQLLTFMCRVIRGESPCLYFTEAFKFAIPDRRISLRNPRLFAVPRCATVSRQYAPLVRANSLLHTLLKLAPQLDIFADKWSCIIERCLELSEKDGRESTVK